MMSDQNIDSTGDSGAAMAELQQGFERRVRGLLSRRPWSWGWGYWTIFVGILSLGVAYRAFWTIILVVPFINADTESYFAPIILHPWAPFSEIRTAGAPLVFMVGASSVMHPVGILLAHHALWLSSSAVLAITVRRYFGLSLLSLVILVYLTFNAKAISFEYYAISEHLSRVMYVFYAAAAFATWRHPRSWLLAATLAGLVVFNVLSKPSAIVLLPATVILYLSHAWRLRRNETRRIISAGVVSFMLIIGGVTAYAAWFKARFGAFNLSSFEGYNLFSHVGHLLDLDGALYPELKRELVPIITLYRSKYVARGIHEPNWLVYGSVNEALKADFGNLSPASLVRAHALRTTGRGDIGTVNRIFFELAVEGIFAHPREYLNHVWTSFNKLIRGGYAFIYYEYLPAPATLDAHRSSTRTFQEILFRLGSVTSSPACEEARAIAQVARWPLRAFLRETTFGCTPAPYDTPGIREAAVKVHGLFVEIAQRIHLLLMALPLWTVGLSVLLIWPPWHGSRARRIAFYAAFLTIAALGYATLLAFFNIAEVARFMVNIQDYLVLAMAFVIATIAVSLRRALLRLWLSAKPPLLKRNGKCLRPSSRQV